MSRNAITHSYPQVLNTRQTRAYFSGHLLAPKIGSAAPDYKNTANKNTGMYPKLRSEFILYSKVHCNIAGAKWGSVDATNSLLLKYNTNTHNLLYLRNPYGKIYGAHTSLNYQDVISYPPPPYWSDFIAILRLTLYTIIQHSL